MATEKYEIGFIRKNKETTENITKVNQVLLSSGIRLTLEPGDGEHDMLTVLFKRNARNAGKKRICFLDNGISCSADQIRAIIKEEGADKAAEYLGCSRATLFRRLKESKKDSSAFF